MKSTSTSGLTKFRTFSDETHEHHISTSSAAGPDRVYFSRSTPDLNMVDSSIHEKNIKRLVDNLTNKDVIIAK